MEFARKDNHRGDMNNHLLSTPSTYLKRPDSYALPTFSAVIIFLKNR